MPWPFATRAAAPPARTEPTPAAPPAETRASRLAYGGDGWAALPSIAFGGAPSAKRAEQLAPTAAALQIISTSIASLPVRLFRERPDGGRAELTDDPVARVLRSPNEHAGWPTVCADYVRSLLLHGNAALAVDRDGSGRPVALRNLDWRNVTARVLPNSNRLVFDLTGSGPPQRHLASDCVHTKEGADGGLIGVARITRSWPVFEAALALDEFAANTWQNQASPSGVLSLGREVTADGLKRLKTIFDQSMTGQANARKVLFADAGTTWNSIQTSPLDSQMVEARRQSAIDQARVWNCPPQLLASNEFGSYSNVSTAGRFFATLTLAPLCKLIEGDLGRALLSDPALHLEFDMSELTRGSPDEQMTTAVAAVGAGILTADEVRSTLGFAPLATVKPTPPEPAIG